MDEIPEDVQQGDYWRCLRPSDRQLAMASEQERADGNLTGGVWMVSPPRVGGIAMLRKHTVREEEDGTISVRPNDGSSNSIRVTGGPNGESWHGYIEHGVWGEC